MSEPFNSIGEFQLGVDRIATSPTAYVLYENPLAMFRGAPAAPRLSPWALANVVEAGASVRYSDSANTPIIQDATPGVWMVMKQVTVLASGTVRVRYQTRRPVGIPSTITTKVTLGRGITLTDLTGDQTHSRTSSSAVIDRELASATIQPGDSIQIHARFQSGDASLSYAGVQNFTLGTSGGYLWALGGGALVVGSEPV